MKKIFLFVLFSFFLVQLTYADSFTVNIPASDGTYKAIIITKEGDTYICPTGEHFDHFPTVYELQALYNGGSVSAPVQQGVPMAGSSDMQPAVQKEQVLRAQMNSSMAAQQQRVDQQKQQFNDYVDRNNKMWVDKAKAEAEAKKQQELKDAQWAADHKKQTDLGELVGIVFSWMMLLLGVVGLVFLLLAHIPSKLNNPHSGEGLSSLVAIRRGMTQANFNVKNSNFLYGEIFVVSVLLGIGLNHFVNGWIIFVVSFIGMIFMTVYKVAGFIMVYIFSLFWMMTAAGFGFYLCGGNFGTYTSIISAVIGGLVFGVAGMAISMGGHLSAIQYAQDIGSN